MRIQITDSKLYIMGVLAVVLFFIASEMAFNDCLSLGVC